MTEEIWRLGACETALAIREGKYSCLEVVQSAAARLSSVNPDLNAVTVDLTKEALDAAKKADLALLKGINAGPLYGVPITLKENISLSSFFQCNSEDEFLRVMEQYEKNRRM